MVSNYLLTKIIKQLIILIKAKFQAINLFLLSDLEENISQGC